MLTDRAIRSAIEMIAHLYELGVRLHAEGNTIHVSDPSELLTPRLLREIERRSLAILVALRDIEAVRRQNEDSRRRVGEAVAAQLRSPSQEVLRMFAALQEGFERQEAAKKARGKR